ncbi:hypothetical protein EG327_002020 [Venturia inaequalis]|uniref:Uncharacterized protein n=1 Tax=Venturia inaequalis TaxID=5025 RepID=A0A8H3VS22_VENIN|nr:hypothetical protein EG327_002020 [Venturia inaequalis]
MRAFSNCGLKTSTPLGGSWTSLHHLELLAAKHSSESGDLATPFSEDVVSRRPWNISDATRYRNRLSRCTASGLGQPILHIDGQPGISRIDDTIESSY